MRSAALFSFLLLAGCHAQAGPVFSYAIGQGARLGWEAGGGWALARGNVGQIYGPHVIEEEGAEAPTTRFGYTSYAVYEPGLILGGTLGLGIRDDFEPSFVGGGWGAIGGIRTLYFQPRCETGFRSDASISAGLRYIGGAFEVYLTPKYLMVDCEVRF